MPWGIAICLFLLWAMPLHIQCQIMFACSYVVFVFSALSVPSACRRLHSICMCLVTAPVNPFSEPSNSPPCMFASFQHVRIVLCLSMACRPCTYTHVPSPDSRHCGSSTPSSLLSSAIQLLCLHSLLPGPFLSVNAWCARLHPRQGALCAAFNLQLAPCEANLSLVLCGILCGLVTEATIYRSRVLLITPDEFCSVPSFWSCACHFELSITSWQTLHVSTPLGLGLISLNLSGNA